MKTKMYFILTLIIFATTTINAQTYQIRSVAKGDGVIGVQLRLTSGTPPTTSNFVTDIIFGLKWLSSYNVDLVDSITSYNIIKSDERKLKGGFHYRAFGANNTPFLFRSNWALNSWVEIMSIDNSHTGVAFGDFLICETGFDISTDPNFGVDLIDYTPIINGFATPVYIGVTLPILLSKFEITPAKNYIQLSWSTSTEINNRGFEVQRSSKDASHFRAVNWVNGSGSSTLLNNYAYLDKQVVPGIIYYYRLKQMDFDGNEKFSFVKSARLTDTNNDAFVIFPNPAASVLQVMAARTIKSNFNLRIIDAKGALVSRHSTSLLQGAKVDINVLSLPAGQYYLVVEQNAETIFQKPFLKK